MNIEELAVILFDKAVEEGQQWAIEEGLDKLGMMPIRSEWEKLSEESKDYWRNMATNSIKGLEVENE